MQICPFPSTVILTVPGLWISWSFHYPYGQDKTENQILFYKDRKYLTMDRIVSAFVDGERQRTAFIHKRSFSFSLFCTKARIPFFGHV